MLIFIFSEKVTKWRFKATVLVHTCFCFYERATSLRLEPDWCTVVWLQNVSHCSESFCVVLLDVWRCVCKCICVCICTVELHLSVIHVKYELGLAVSGLIPHSIQAAWFTMYVQYISVMMWGYYVYALFCFLKSGLRNKMWTLHPENMSLTFKGVC